MSLGKGGMGEVFRADDLALGQSVALKFLPEKVARDPERTRRLRGEVRTARQVGHPNVCRVYDLGQASGQLFLSMEYIDGQNLAALLAQIRHLPEERGLELARQLCLGLGAIHDRGLLHRDLKPANVMVDGRGNVRITDFGLAVPVEEVAAGDARDGTPAYQAPEQLAGQEVTQRSDLYALGLILHEVFTGKRPEVAIDRATPDATVGPSKSSSKLSGLNPAIESVINKCLAANPAQRPRSAYEVLAVLPGGDPLQAALTAGKTPSPEEVADAKVEGTLHPLAALGLLATVIALLVFVVVNAGKLRLFQVVPQQHSPSELARKAQEVLRELGHSSPDKFIQYGLDDSQAVMAYLRQRTAPNDRWRPLSVGQPPAIYLWYRQSPEPMHPRLTPNPNANDPTCTALGMTRVCLDLKGRLVEFEAGPSVAPSAASPPVWPPILALAGLSDLQPATPDGSPLNPPSGTQDRLSWTGVYTDSPEIRCRVEAGLRDNRLLYFHVRPADAAAWGPGWLADTKSMSDVTRDWWLEFVVYLLIFLSLVIGITFAWHNLQVGRANVRGAIIFAIALGFVHIVRRLCDHHAGYSLPVDGLNLSEVLGSAVIAALITCMLYVALEPFVRSRWPWRIVAWNRLLMGRCFDSLVGRDLLIGAVGGLVLRMTGQALPWLRPGTDPSAWEPLGTVSLYWVVRPIPAEIAQSLIVGMASTMYYLFVFFVVFLLTRREWLTAVVLVVGPVVLQALAPSEEGLVLLSMVNTAFICIVHIGLLLRFGLLAVATAAFVRELLSAPLTFDLQAWYADRSYAVLAIILGLTLFGIVTSTRSRWSKWITAITGELLPSPEAATSS